MTVLFLTSVYHIWCPQILINRVTRSKRKCFPVSSSWDCPQFPTEAASPEWSDPVERCLLKYTPLSVPALPVGAFSDSQEAGKLVGKGC